MTAVVVRGWSKSLESIERNNWGRTGVLNLFLHSEVAEDPTDASLTLYVHFFQGVVLPA